MSLLSLFTFGNPLALWGLLSIPGIWLLLKIYPPAPKSIFFPTIRFLKDITNEEETAGKTPLWLLIFRIFLVIILVLAFSNPIYNAKPNLLNKGPLLLIIDNGWSSSINWEKRKENLIEYIDRAEQQKLPIIILPSAPKHNVIENNITLLNSSEAKSKVEGLKPNPWPSDYNLLIQTIDNLPKEKIYNIIWLWDGVDHENNDSSQIFAKKLESIGKLHVLDFLNNSSIKIIKSVNTINNNNLTVKIQRNIGSLEENVFIRANGLNGKLLNRKELSFKENDRNTETEILIPNELRNDLVSISIENVNNAGATFLLDEKWRKRSVGIYAKKESFRTQPLLSPAYYLDRAINSFHDVEIAQLENLIQKNLSVIILPGIGTIGEELNIKLKEWIKNGGILIRFAGPNLEGSNTDLLPVKLRSIDSREFGGALSWSKPVSIKDFPINSPLYGLKIDKDVLIKKQVIAEPSADLGKKTWASLEDGTPLITGQQYEKGWNVFFHITANAEWSNLPLTATFVEILNNIINLSSGEVNLNNSIPLMPYKLIDGFGRLVEPSSGALPTNFNKKNLIPSSGHAPGFYGNELFMQALNLGNRLNGLSPQTITFQDDTIIEKFASENNINLKSFFLITSLILIFIDYFISLHVRGRINLKKLIKISKFIITLSLCQIVYNINTAEAKNKTSALETHLAYIITQNDEIDSISYLGLSELTRILRERTSLEAATPVGININKDDLSFYPLIYWPIAAKYKILSDKSIKKIQVYMENGGLIVFDTRDQSPNNIISKKVTQEQISLKKILKLLDLPALIKVPESHVIRRSFYLLDKLPGRYTGGNVWVEATAKNSRDGVSSIIIGGNNWAAAWAKDASNKPLFTVIPGGEKQREFSYRFGVNLVMYSMTGNYKADQVHIKSILKRLNNKDKISE
jgi:hypothetical protein